MRISQLKDTLKFSMKNNMRVFMSGPPGIGKTAIFNQACEELNAEYAEELGFIPDLDSKVDPPTCMDSVIFHPSISDPTEPKGLPFLSKEGETAEFIPYGHLDKLNKATRPVQVLLDDFPQATASVQASYMSLLDRFRDNEFVNFFIAGNRTQDFAGSNGVLEPIKSRMDSIINVETSLEDYIDYGRKTGMSTSIIAFLRFKPALLYSDKLTKDLVNTYCPRTITAVDSWLARGLEVSSTITRAEAKALLDGAKKNASSVKQSYSFEIIAGAVGEGWAIEYIAFERLRRTMPDLNKILANPEEVPVPEDPAVLFSLVGGLASRIVPEKKDKNLKKLMTSNFTNALTYIESIQKEFQVYFVKDVFAYFPENGLEKVPKFFEWSQHNQDVLI